MITNSQSGTNVHEVADGIYRINTPVTLPGGVGQFSFNQYLLLDDEPMLFHTGLRALFPVVSEAIGSLMPIEKLRYVGFSHFESDECGTLNQFLALAPRVPVRTEVETFPLTEANQALSRLRSGKLHGAAVLTMD